MDKIIIRKFFQFIIVNLLFIRQVHGQINRENMPGSKFYDGKKIILPISSDSTIQLYDHWIHQGISSLIAIYGKKRL